MIQLWARRITKKDLNNKRNSIQFKNYLDIIHKPLNKNEVKYYSYKIDLAFIGRYNDFGLTKPEFLIIFDTSTKDITLYSFFEYDAYNTSKDLILELAKLNLNQVSKNQYNRLNHEVFKLNNSNGLSDYYIEFHKNNNFIILDRVSNSNQYRDVLYEKLYFTDEDFLKVTSNKIKTYFDILNNEYERINNEIKKLSKNYNSLNVGKRIGEFISGGLIYDIDFNKKIYKIVSRIDQCANCILIQEKDNFPITQILFNYDDFFEIIARGKFGWKLPSIEESKKISHLKSVLNIKGTYYTNQLTKEKKPITYNFDLNTFEPVGHNNVNHRFRAVREVPFDKLDIIYPKLSQIEDSLNNLIVNKNYQNSINFYDEQQSKNESKTDNKFSVIGNPIRIGNLEVAQNDFPNRMKWDDAKKACSDLGDGWRLPTINELNILYKNKKIIGKYLKDGYWSSTEIDTYTSYYVNFGNDDEFGNRQGKSEKDIEANVRIVRNY